MGLLFIYDNTTQFPPDGLSTAGGFRHGICVPKMLIMSGCGTPRGPFGAEALRTLRPLPLLGSLFPPLAALTFPASGILSLLS